MRESAAAWRELRFRDDGNGADVNEVPRAKVLWALQYDRRPEDLPLVRFLAEQEGTCRREAPFQGIGEQTQLAGFLLAEHGLAEDVWRQYAIKRANFDTWCGYDQEHVFAGGAEETAELVRASDHPERDELLEFLRERAVDDEDVRTWLDGRREWYPDDPAAEDPLTWVERARMVGDLEFARAELDRWTAGRERDLHTLNLLRHELVDLGEFAEAAAVQREALGFAETARDRAEGWLILAGLRRRAGDHTAAWEALRERVKALDTSGRDLVEELYLLAGVAEIGLAREVFAEAERRARDVPGLPPVVLRAAAAAAERCR